VSQDGQAEITALLKRVSGGDDAAAEALVPQVYDELRQLARHQRRWRGDETLNTTALAHEAYLKVLAKTGADWLSRRHFYAVASRAMRHILVNYSRDQRAEKRGGDAEHVAFEEERVVGDGMDADRIDLVLAVDDALRQLGERSPELVAIVELRFFFGFSVEEVAEMTEQSPRTVKRQWAKARAWLQLALEVDPLS